MEEKKKGQFEKALVLMTRAFTLNHWGEAEMKCMGTPFEGLAKQALVMIDEEKAQLEKELAIILDTLLDPMAVAAVQIKEMMDAEIVPEEK